MKVYFVGYIAALVALVVFDALWLGAMSRDFYKVRLGQLLLEQPNWYAAILFYLVRFGDRRVRRAARRIMGIGGALRGAVRLLRLRCL
jgi:hypothetical protein